MSGVVTKKVSTKEIDLSHAHTEETGENDLSEVFDARVGEIDSKIETHAAAYQLRDKNEELKGAANEDAYGQRNGRALKVMPDKGRGKNDDGEVLQGGGGRRQGKIVKGVENAHAESSEACKEEIGEDDAVEGSGLNPTAGAVLRRGKGLDHDGGEDDAKNGDYSQNEGEGPEQAISKAPKLLGGVVSHVLGKDGDEGSGDDTIAHQTAKQIGKAVGKDEGIGGKGGAEKEGDALVSDVAKDAASDGNQRDDGGGFEDLRLFGQMRPLGDLKPIKTMS
jgi:hypothetical protein